MGFLAKLFKSKEILYLESFIAELKQDKERLIKEVDELKTKIQILNEKTLSNKIKSSQNSSNNTKKKLSKLELRVYSGIKDNNYNNIEEVSKDLNIKLSSLRVYIGRIRKKGYIVNI